MTHFCIQCCKMFGDRFFVLLCLRQYPEKVHPLKNANKSSQLQDRAKKTSKKKKKFVLLFMAELIGLMMGLILIVTLTTKY